MPSSAITYGYSYDTAITSFFSSSTSQLTGTGLGYGKTGGLLSLRWGALIRTNTTTQVTSAADLLLHHHFIDISIVSGFSSTCQGRKRARNLVSLIDYDRMMFPASLGVVYALVLVLNKQPQNWDEIHWWRCQITLLYPRVSTTLIYQWRRNVKQRLVFPRIVLQL